MRGIDAELDYRRPAGLPEALALLECEPGAWTTLAGGTDLLVQHEAGLLGPRRLLDLGALPELAGIRADDEMIEIGSTTCYTEIQAHALIQRELPLLAQAARETGAWAIQERGTLGGNLANASPAADSVPALIAHGARLRLAAARGERELPVEDFFLSYRRTALGPDELIRSVRLPRGGVRTAYFRKVGTRRAQAISKVALAAVGAWTDGGLVCRIAVASVAPIPLRCRETENFLAFHAGEAYWMDGAVRCLQDEIQPIDDLRSTAAYRRAVAGNLLRAFLRRCDAGRGIR